MTDTDLLQRFAADQSQSAFGEMFGRRLAPFFRPLVLCACLALADTAQAVPTPTDAQVVATVQAAVETQVAADRFSGAVLVARKGRVLFEHAYGYADHAFNAPNRIDTKFNIASMGKMFTGVGILQLAQAGKLSLDDSIGHLLPTYPNTEVAAKVTVRELLNHTSGLGDFFGPEFIAANMGRLDTLESLVPFFVHQPLRFAPGTSWSYSNAGYIVLGLIIQQVSGESYYDYVRRHVFMAAGMTSTDNWPADADIPNRAVGYTAADEASGPRKSNIFSLQRGGAAGGGYSTVEDLLRFAEALQGGKLLNAEYTARALSGGVATTRPGIKYGFGLEETTLNGVRILGHNGGGPGIQDTVDLYPDLGYVVVILANYDDAMTPVNAKVRNTLTGTPTPAVVPLPPERLALLAGSYQPVLPAEMAGMNPPPITVAVEGEGLSVDPGMGPTHRFVPMGDGNFFDPDNPSLRLRFDQQPGQAAAALVTPTGFGPVPPITARRVR